MCRIFSKYAATVLVLAAFCCTMTGWAQAPPTAQPSSTQFDITGVLQAATLDTPTGPYVPQSQAFWGGTLTVNGKKVIVPANTVVQYPANNSSWGELFAKAPGIYGPKKQASFPNGQSGMAQSDSPQPLTTWEVNVVGNRVIVPSVGAPGTPGYVAGKDDYIAGLITFSQQALNSGAGFINYIDYGTGEMRVGGLIGDKTTGARVRINDPDIGDPANPGGRYGRAQTPDQRFSADQDNPTIRSGTGYPMGVPRTDPATIGGDDILRPQSNRPKDGTGQFLTYIDAQVNAIDATRQAPFEVGDYVNYAGTLVRDDNGADGSTEGPPSKLTATNSFISAHTIVDNAAIYTLPGVNPAYVAIEVTILGTGGVQVPGLTEIAIRTRFEGFTTDPSRNVYLYGIDLDPLVPGNVVNRDWGSIDIDQGAPTGAARGRWRFRPNKQVSLNPKGTGALSLPAAGNFGYPAREVRAVIGNATSIGGTAWTGRTDANGIISGQYHAPISEYLFPEQVPGSPIPANNFEMFQWMAQGGQITSSGMAGPLRPWPGLIVPDLVTGKPVVNAGADQTVNSSTPAVPVTVTLNGTATDPNNAGLTYLWTQTAGPGVALKSANSAVATFTAPTVLAGAKPLSLTFQLSATDGKGLTNNVLPACFVTVTVNPSAKAAPIINIVSVTQRKSQFRLTILATVTGSNGTDVLTMSTRGAANNISVPMTFNTPAAPGQYSATIGVNGYDATSIVISSDTGGSATMTNTDPLWKIR